MDHDQNFKNLVLEYPRDALKLFATDEAAFIDGATRITPIRQEQLKDRLGDRFRELDIPLLVEWPDGTSEALLFVVEEESDPRRFSIQRLAHYCLDLSELIDTDRVVPVVIFLRDGRYRTHLVLGGDHHTYLKFSYLHCALSRLPWEKYRDSGNLVARLNLPNMCYEPENRVEVYARAVRGLLDLEPDPEKQYKYLDFIDIYSGLSDNELRTYHEQYPKEVEQVSGFAERFKQQGLEQGRRVGEAAVLLRLIERKFGSLTPEVRQRIEEADAETLLQWADRILTANTPEEIWH